jgi:hypothetical protein
LRVFALSILLTWAFNFPAGLLGVLPNGPSDEVLAFVLYAVLAGVAAAAVVALTGPRRLSRKPPSEAATAP